MTNTYTYMFFNIKKPLKHNDIVTQLFLNKQSLASMQLVEASNDNSGAGFRDGNKTSTIMTLITCAGDNKLRHGKIGIRESTTR